MLIHCHSSRGVCICIKHGAKVKQCSSDGCITSVFIWHGADVKQCSSDGCSMPKMEEFALGMGQRANYVALTDSEGCACANQTQRGGDCKSLEHIAIIVMNLLIRSNMN
eukprot:scaffold15184_cov147-Skeletonema_dohrnii-CCMP3373.AAC.3